MLQFSHIRILLVTFSVSLGITLLSFGMDFLNEVSITFHDFYFQIYPVFIFLLLWTIQIYGIYLNKIFFKKIGIKNEIKLMLIFTAILTFYLTYFGCLLYAHYSVSAVVEFFSREGVSQQTSIGFYVSIAGVILLIILQFVLEIKLLNKLKAINQNKL
ncbi:hypothetical protein OO013_04800 [Mangrovivirga sp. M17]|uniref:DUF4149 domain-containing protein n=1 Tax=Mangrovivirga halotolerans TaxID=2993936 RepID=A0ABT3RPT0_9BACT|nr:hypothetical protein [Mangrovivirga halotolerans]MCX2743170.1 hypothetical protein [Mangrovivirga halotolerans]